MNDQINHSYNDEKYHLIKLEEIYEAFDVSQGKSQDKAIIKGNFYRITILSERLVRLEYSKHGIFNDNVHICMHILYFCTNKINRI